MSKYLHKNKTFIDNNKRALNTAEAVLMHLYRFEYNDLSCPELPNALKAAFMYLNKVQSTQGTAQFLKFIKTSRQIIFRYLARGSTKSIEAPLLSTGIRTDRDGLPSWLGYLKTKEALEDPKQLRYTMTILYSSRGLSFDAKVDYSILETTGQVPVNPRFVDFLRSELNSYKDLPLKFRTGRVIFHTSTKAGPNGPAMMNSLLDVYPMEPEYRSDLVKFIKILDPRSYVIIPLEDKEFYESPLSKRTQVRRKLTELKDKEGKVRIIAIADYWTQAAMKPLHTGIAACLKGLYADCTFNQNHFKDALDPYFDGQTFYSIDLKSATELMPSNGQAEVLKWISGSNELGDLGLSLMTKYEGDRPGGLNPIRFARGQPMGVYSSGPLMALTHHLIYRGSLIERGILELTEPYFMLGDDMLIIGDRNFAAYQWGIEQAFMVLNRDKTFASKNFFEFAKRHFYKKQEVSPFPMGALLSSKGDVNTIGVAIDNAFAKSGLSGLSHHRLARRGLFNGLIQTLSPGSPYRLSEVLEKGIGLTSLYRWATRSDPAEAPSLGNLFMDRPCNISTPLYREFLLYGIGLTLQREASKHLKSSLESCGEIQNSLMASPLKKTPKLLGYHPTAMLVVSKRRLLSDMQMDLYTSLESLGRINYDSLMEIIIEPVPSIKALYRANDKASVRRSQVLSRLAGDIISITSGKDLKDLHLGYDEACITRSRLV